MIKKTLIWALIISLSFEQTLFWSTQARAHEGPIEKADLNAEQQAALEQDQARVNALLAEVNQVPEGQFPGASPDIHGLTGQTLEVARYTNITDDSRAVQFFNRIKAYFQRAGLPYEQNVEIKMHDLGSFEAPIVVPPDFDHDVSVQIDNAGKSFSLAYYSKGRFIARQKFASTPSRTYDIVSFSRDEDYLILADRSGKIYAMDLEIPRKYAFNSVIPVWQIFDFKRTLNESYAAMFLESGVGDMEVDSDPVVPLDISRDSKLLMGAFALVRKDGGKRKISALLARTKLGDAVAERETSLRQQVDSITPPQEAQEVFNQLDREEADLKQRLQAEDQEMEKTAITEISLARKLKKEYGTLLGSRKIYNSSIGKQHVHTTTIGGMQTEFDDLFAGAEELTAEKEAQLAEYQQNLQGMRLVKDRLVRAVGGKTKAQNLTEEIAGLQEQMNQRNLSRARTEILKSRADKEVAIILQNQKSERTRLKRTWTPLKLGIIAALTAGIAVVGYAAPAWGIHIYNSILSLQIFDVLRNADYRSLLFKSIPLQELIIPFANILGIFSLVVIAKKGWHYSQALAKATLNLCSILVLSPLHRLMQLLGQPLYMKALQRGVRNPLVKLPGYEDVYPYVSNRPSWLKLPGDTDWTQEKYKQVISKKAEALDILESRKNTSEKFAMALATMLVAEQAKQDPVLVELLAEQGPMSAEKIREFVSSNGFKKQWKMTAYELQSRLLVMDSFLHVTDFQDMKREDFAEAIRVAREVSSRIKNAGIAESAMIKSRQLFNRGFNWMLSYIGGWGVKATQFLRNVHPAADLSQAQIKQFNWDMGFAILIMASTGAHADFSDPRMLMAKENAFMYTNPFVLSEDFEQVWIYLGTSFANQLISMHRDIVPTAQARYAANEFIRLQGVERTENVVRSFWEQLKDLANLPKSRLGDYPFRKFKTDMDLLWVRMAGFDLFKMGIIGYGLASATGRFFFTQLVGFWWINTSWLPIMRGIQMRTERLENKAFELAERRAKVAQDLRLEEMSEAALDIPKLADLYPNRQTLPPAIRSFLDELSEFVQNPTEERASELENGMKQYGPQLVQFTRENPPYATKANDKFDHLAMIVGSFTSTFIYTYITKYANSTNLLGEFIKNIPIVAGLYAGSWGVQKAADKTFPIFQKWRDSKKVERPSEEQQRLLENNCRTRLLQILGK